MPLAEFQAALARLLADRNLRDQVLGMPPRSAIPAELASYRLSAEDWQNLQAISPPRLTLYAHLLRDKRLSKISRCLPWTMVLLRATMADLVSIYFQQHMPVTISALDESRTFCAFLVQQGLRLTPPYASDVARYELLMSTYAEDCSLARSADPHSHPSVGELTSAQLEQSYCRKSDTVDIVTFQYDLEQILPSLQNGQQPPIALTPAATAVLFHIRSGRNAPTTYKLSRDLHRMLLMLCDARQPIGSTLSELMALSRVSRAQRHDTREGFLAIVKTFITAGILELRQSPLRSTLFK